MKTTITVRRMNLTIKFETLEEYVFWEAAECIELGFEYSMYLDYMSQWSANPTCSIVVTITREQYELLEEYLTR